MPWCELWCCGVGEKKHLKMVWPYGENAGGRIRQESIYSTSELEGVGIRGRPPASFRWVVDGYVKDRIDRRAISIENAKQMCLD